MNIEDSAIFGICLVDFNHTRGPEVEYWYGLDDDINTDELWPSLPFQALPDGSHSYKETFTYFSLLYNEKLKKGPAKSNVSLKKSRDGNFRDYTTLFCISCSRQLKGEELKDKDIQLKRSIIQKSLVVISRRPIFGQIKDKLSIVTNVFFEQKDFTDKSILISLYDNLVSNFKLQHFDDSSLYVGLNLRKVVHNFRKDILILIKAILLEKKIIFYGHDVEYLCNLEYSLISMIPGLISRLQNSGSPVLYKSSKTYDKVLSFDPSDKHSQIKYLGMPLLVYEKGGFFSPYIPLQQIDDLKSKNSQFFTVGTSNTLLLERKEELCQVFVDVDNFKIEIVDPTISSALQLSYSDNRWISLVIDAVEKTWNDRDASDMQTPDSSTFNGSDDFVRSRFEDYFMGLISSAKLERFLKENKDDKATLNTIPSEYRDIHPVTLHGLEFYKIWKKTQNYKIMNKMTEEKVFLEFKPRHDYQQYDTMAQIKQGFTGTFERMKFGIPKKPVERKPWKPEPEEPPALEFSNPWKGVWPKKQPKFSIDRNEKPPEPVKRLRTADIRNKVKDQRAQEITKQLREKDLPPPEEKKKKKKKKKKSKTEDGEEVDGEKKKKKKKKKKKSKDIVPPATTTDDDSVLKVESNDNDVKLIREKTASSVSSSPADKKKKKSKKDSEASDSEYEAEDEKSVMPKNIKVKPVDNESSNNHEIENISEATETNSADDIQIKNTSKDEQQHTEVESSKVPETVAPVVEENENTSDDGQSYTEPESDNNSSDNDGTHTIIEKKKDHKKSKKSKNSKESSVEKSKESSVEKSKDKKKEHLVDTETEESDSDKKAVKAKKDDEKKKEKEPETSESESENSESESESEPEEDLSKKYLKDFESEGSKKESKKTKSEEPEPVTKVDTPLTDTKVNEDTEDIKEEEKLEKKESDRVEKEPSADVKSTPETKEPSEDKKSISDSKQDTENKLTSETKEDAENKYYSDVEGKTKSASDADDKLEEKSKVKSDAEEESTKGETASIKSEKEDKVEEKNEGASTDN